MKILYLVHRIPYPPDKGDKIRSWHWLRHLAERHEIHLVTLVDDPDDLRHRRVLEDICEEIHLVPMSPRRAKITALATLPAGRALSLSYFGHRDAHRAVADIQTRVAPDLVFGYSAPMAMYADSFRGTPRVMDMVDVDSAKFAAYAERTRGPSRWIYRVEAKRLARFEEQVARDFDATILCTEPEADMLRGRVGTERVDVVRNGVVVPDTVASRDGGDELVFVGAMDYYANVDAVVFAADEIMPRVRARRPNAVLRIVGRSPTAAVRDLARRDGVEVVVNPPDVGPELLRADLSVIPLRIARGIQNKVLEAMAYGLPVVTAPKVAAALGARDDAEILCADTAQNYADHIVSVLEDRSRSDRLARAGRGFVESTFSWSGAYAALDHVVESVMEARPGGVGVS